MVPVYKNSTAWNGSLLNYLVDIAQIHAEFEIPSPIFRLRIWDRVNQAPVTVHSLELMLYL